MARTGTIAGVAVALLGAAGATPAAAARELRLLAAYSIEPGSHWITSPRPALSRRPALAAVAGADFAVSFDCAARPDGGLADCRTIVARPAGLDATPIVARLSAAIRLDPSAVARMKADRYRVTIDAASMDFPEPWTPSSPCTGPTCYRDAPPAPPPLPQPADPVLSYLLASDHACFDAAWARTSTAADAADAALRNASPAAGSPAYRTLALNYLRARQGLASCVLDLQRTSGSIPLDASDGRVRDAHRDTMSDGYRAVDRDLIAVLAGALDAGAAADERATSF